jgi:hypothetical protein
MCKVVCDWLSYYIREFPSYMHAVLKMVNSKTNVT